MADPVVRQFVGTEDNDDDDDDESRNIRSRSSTGPIHSAKS